MIQFESIPRPLAEIHQWVLWKYEPVEDKPDKMTKVPYKAFGSGKASSTNPKTWAPLASAVERYQGGGYDGVGFVVTSDIGIIGVDLDHCLDTSTGEIAAWAESIVDELKTYTEITPSGEGLRCFGFGTLPEGGRKKGDFECYTAGRFLTVTGQKLDGADNLVEITDFLAPIHARIFESQKEEAAPPMPASAPSMDDRELLQKMFSSKNGEKWAAMYAGAWQTYYTSQSEADAALCFSLAFWCRRDASAMDRLFRGSGLMRSKWDKAHGADGRTYGQMTVDGAVNKVATVYEPPAPPVRLLRRNTTHYVKTGDEGEQENELDGEQAVEIPYAVENGRIVFVIDKVNRQGESTSSSAVVADFAACIEEEIAVEDGEPTYHLALRTPVYNSGVYRVEMGAKAFASGVQLAAVLSTIAGAQFGVRAGMEKHLPPALKLLTENFTRSERFNRTGWRERLGEEATFLIPGLLAANTSIQIPPKLAYNLNPKAELDKGLEALEHLIRAQDQMATTLAITTFFQAPLCALAGWRNERYCLFISGRSGSLKSSWAQVAQCLYGPDFINDHNIIKWGEGSTSVALMLYASYARDLPLLIDNYKPNVGGGARAFVSIIHNILEGSEKDRGTKEIKLREAKLIDTWPIGTGEDLPDADAAAVARLLPVWFSFDDRDIARLTLAQKYSSHLCAVGRLWIEWLQSDEGRKAAKEASESFVHERATWTAFLKEKHPNMVNPLRVATNLATNELTWQTMKKCPPLRAILVEYEKKHKAGLKNVAGNLGVSTLEASEGAKYLNALRELIDTERCLLITRTHNIPAQEADRIIGYHDDDAKNDGGAFLLPGAAMKAVLSHIGRDALNGLSEAMIYRQLKELGVLASWNNDSPLKTVRTGSKTQRLLHLHKRALSGGDEVEIPP